MRGRDGRVREYASRPYAADYVKNPLGDMLVNMPDFKVSHRADVRAAARNVAL